jgi:transposase
VALKELANSLPASTQREIIALEISYLVQDIRNQTASLKVVDAELARHVQAYAPARKLLDMPGVGAFTAAAVSGELGPLARTSTEAQVATYAGLTPVARKSGTLGRDRLARGVNKHAQQACYMSAIASLTKSALDEAYYRKVRASHVGHPKAHVVATLGLARQRIKVMYKLMRTDAVYDREVLLSRHLERERLAA